MKNYSKILTLLTITLAAASGQAATLVNTTNTVLTTNNNVGNSYQISVFDTKASYKTGSGSTVVMGDGTVEDYAFYNDGAGTFAAYAEGSASIIGTSTATDVSGAGSDISASVWTSDPGTDFSTTADFADPAETAAKARIVDGSLDLSGYASGTVYFFFGNFGPETDTISLTLSGTGQTNVLANTGALSTGTQYTVAEFTFTTDNGLYDTLDFNYTNSDNDASPGSRARFNGVVIDAVTVPEPSTAALLGLGGFALALIRRRRS